MADSSASLSLRFTADQFDHESDLPAEYNAGNRFYGRDVAAFLSDGLTARKFDSTFLDEDWGWLVTGRADDVGFDIAIYNLNDHDEGGRPGSSDWGLWVQAYQRKRLFGVIPRRVDVAVPKRLELGIRAVLATNGIVASAWDDGPQR